MTETNEITGDQLKSKPVNKAYDDGYDKIDWDKRELDSKGESANVKLSGCQDSRQSTRTDS